MQRLGSWRPTPALVIAVLALFVALGGSAYAVRQINGRLIKNRTIAGAKLKNNTLGDRQISDSKVSGVMAAATLGRSASDPDGNCDPQGGAGGPFINCVSVSLNLPRDGRVLLVASGGQVNVQGSPTAGTCRLSADGAVLAGTSQDVGDDVFSHFNDEDNGFATNTVTGNLAEGPHTFALSCNEEDPNVAFHTTRISAVFIGTG